MFTTIHFIYYDLWFCVRAGHADSAYAVSCISDIHMYAYIFQICVISFLFHADMCLYQRMWSYILSQSAWSALFCILYFEAEYILFWKRLWAWAVKKRRRILTCLRHQLRIAFGWDGWEAQIRIGSLAFGRRKRTRCCRIPNLLRIKFGGTQLIKKLLELDECRRNRIAIYQEGVSKIKTEWCNIGVWFEIQNGTFLLI